MSQNKFIGQVREYNRYADGKVREAIKLDLVDKKILYILHQNARYSNTAIAKKLRLKRETVAYRIKRMMESNFLYGNLTLLDHRRLGLRNYLIYIKLKTLSDEKKLIDFLFDFDQITRLKNCSGSYDIQILASVRQEEEFVQLLDNIIDDYHHVIHGYDILEILEEDFLGLDFILRGEECSQLNISERKGSTFQKEFEASKGDHSQVKLDRKDKEILELLKLEAAASIRHISEKVNLAPVAVDNRIKKMILSGVIKRFMPLASLSQMGYQWWKVFFKFKHLNKEKFFTFLKYHSNVVWYIKMIGRWDYHLSVFARDNADFHRIIDEIRTEFSENIISYDSIIIFNQFKYVQKV